MLLFVVEIQGLRDNQPREMLVTVDTSQDSEVGKSQHKARKRSNRRKETQPQSTGSEESYQTELSEELFEVKRYPAYHYDMYGTIYSLTDGVRPTTLERDTMKSASADCLDVHSASAQASERPASNDDVHHSVTQSSAVTAEQHKPKPPKPLPRPKPRTQQGAVFSKDTASVDSASTDSAFVAELSSLLKQRNQ